MKKIENLEYTSSNKHRSNNLLTLFLLFLLVGMLVLLFKTIGDIGRENSVLKSGFTIKAVNRSENLAQKNTTISANLISSASPSLRPQVKGVSIQIPPNSGRSVRVPILMYHYIGNNPNPADKARDSLSVAPDKFDNQLGYLAKNGYNPISLDTLYAALKGKAALPSRPVILTFDDGYIDFYINAFPILRKYNFHAISFIPTGLMNQGYYMSWSQIKEIDSSGLVIFQAHTVNHLNLPSLPISKVRYQLAESKRILEAQLGKPINFLAYPYGTSNQAIWEQVRQVGFLGAVGTWGGKVESEGNIFNMPRIRIGGGMDLHTFAASL